MPKRSESLQVVLEECQKFATQLPLKRRAALYRGLAEVCGNTQDAAAYTGLADECDTLRKREAKLQFDLSMDGGRE
jgi:hypothetical protein